MDQDSAAKPRRSLRDIFEKMDSAENPERELLNLVLDGARKKDPELEEILRACAIPRRFDRRVIGVLREKRNEEDRNQQLLDMIRTHSFVTPRQDGGFVYHDNMREALLEEWASSPQKKGKFVELNNRLAGFYEEEHGKAQKLEQDLILVSAVMRLANAARYRWLAALVEKSLLSPLLEALYHHLLASPGDGFGFFRNQFHRQEEAGRLIICQALISATRDFLLRLPPERHDLQQAAWLDYFEARILRQLPPFDFQGAEEKFRRLSERPELETQLRIWALSDLSIVEEAQMKLRDQAVTLQRLLALVGETGKEDIYNLPIYYSHLAHLFWVLGELGRAQEYFRMAIGKSETMARTRPDSRVRARLDLSGVSCEVGQWEKGMETGVEALFLARTEFGADPWVQRDAAYRLMYLLSVSDLRAADTAAAEYLSLVRVPEGSDLDSLDRFIGALNTGERNRYAEVQLGRLHEETERSENPSLFRAKLLFRKALVSESRGRHEEAVGIYTQLIHLEEGQIDKWTLAAALSNRGRQMSIQGRWDSAEDDLRAALRLWESYGHETLIAFVRVLLGDLMRVRGLLSQAQRELDQAAGVLLDGSRSYAEFFHLVQGDVHYSAGKWGPAREHFRMAREVSAARRLGRTAVKALQKLSEVAGDGADWELAAESAAGAAEESSHLASVDAYHPTPADEAANRKNVDGMRLYCEGSDFEQAGELFKSAMEEAPSNFWYPLNLAFTHARVKDWEEAANALDRALSLAPEAIRTARFYACLREYRARQAEDHARKGEYASASQVIRSLLAALGTKLPPSDLLELQLKLGDYLWNAGKPEDARKTYRSGLKEAGERDLVPEQMPFSARLGFLAVLDGESGTAAAIFKNAMARAGSGAPQLIPSAFGRLGNLIHTPEQFYSFWEFLGALTLDREIDGRVRRPIGRVRLDLTGRFYRPAVFPGEKAKPPRGSPRVPVATPIALEIDARMIPSDDTPGLKWMLDQGFPAMRERIRGDLGVRIPGIRIRANEANPEGGYFHSLHDTPLYLYTVYGAERFCADAVRCREAGLSGRVAQNPVPPGGQGMWLGESEWPRARAAGLQLWDPFEVMVLHTEQVIRTHLPLFFGVQELQNLLDDWAAGRVPPEDVSADRQAFRQKLVARALPDEDAERRLLQALRALLHEGIPIKDLETILNEYGKANSAERDAVEIAEDLRWALRSKMPADGEEKGRPLIRLPRQLEEIIASGIHRQERKVFLALAPERTQEFLSGVRKAIGGSPPDALAVVLSAPESRPFAKRVVEYEFPGISVLAERELNPKEAKEQGDQR